MKTENTQQIKAPINNGLDCLENIVEAILFVAGEGIEITVLQDKLEISTEKMVEVIKNLSAKFSGKEGIQLIKYKNKLQFSSNPSYSERIESILNPIKERQLSKATLEVLAIVAYKQPITRLEIEDIRGVNSDYAVEVLDKHNLIEVVGRKDSVGKPLLFGTTEIFLKRFDLESLNELPNYDELLTRLKTIEATENASKDNIVDSLYNEFKIEEEPIPEFLQNESNIERV